MNPLTLLKANFAANLEKSGSSLEELDKALATINQTEGAAKIASLLKQAFAGLDKINPIDIGLKGVSGGLGGLALGGYTGASILDAADEDINKENKKLQTYRDKINLLKKLTHKIHQENV